VITFPFKSQVPSNLRLQVDVANNILDMFASTTDVAPADAPLVVLGSAPGMALAPSGSSTRTATTRTTPTGSSGASVVTGAQTPATATAATAPAPPTTLRLGALTHPSVQLRSGDNAIRSGGQVVLNSPPGHLDARVKSELVEDVDRVEFSSVLGDDEGFGNLAVCQTVSNQPRNLRLAPCQRVSPGRAARLTHLRGLQGQGNRLSER
jgi:hypothetical protein